MAEEILVTGGAGYIGSHCVLELLQAGFVPVVIDNFHNAIRGSEELPESLRRVQEIAHRPVLFQELDITDEAALQELFRKSEPHRDHPAAGDHEGPRREEHRVQQLRHRLRGPQVPPPGREPPGGGLHQPLRQIQVLHRGDDPGSLQSREGLERRPPALLQPHRRPRVGDDRRGSSRDPQQPHALRGSGVRDYIHVVDLAKGHIAALKKLKENCGCKIYNLGTGTGYSVLQMVRAMEKASGREIKYQITARREGDVASCYADPALAERELGWKAAFGLDKMCEDLWRWQLQNPTGFSKN
ncbi:PREDICTED: UDP-glucose 4-epimerase isoform X3 [Pseudopodoces humilis]|uniref:UDP-glucose 4-epimerase isoform X3 n=1 Tax=Pseudopodoces humilis TaxID=181119 RepID=UPI0006B70469|nr:PREDICTED: UDP-glucose 4-epimerase isoform X3 [Pseudopodoces humilis]